MKVFLVLIFLSLVLVSCNSFKNGSIDFKTFDEYSLKGIDSISDIEKSKGYISIKRYPDSILVRAFYPNSDTWEITEYFNKKDYWCSKQKITNLEREEGEAGWFNHKQKFVFNDTILEYEYTNRDSIVMFQCLTVSTRKDKFIVFITPQDTAISGTFESLKEIAMNPYKFDYTLEADSTKISYLHYTKVIKGDTLFVYEKSPKQLQLLNGCLQNVYLLNNLGEFGLEDAINITPEFYNSDHDLPCE